MRNLKILAIDDYEFADTVGLYEQARRLDGAPTFYAEVSGLGEHLDAAIADQENEWGHVGGGALTPEAYVGETLAWIEADQRADSICGVVPTEADGAGWASQQLKKLTISMDYVRVGLGIVKLALLAKAIRTTVKLVKACGSLSNAYRSARALSAAQRMAKFALIGMIVSIAIVWVMFGLYYNSIKSDPVALRLAIGLAIVNTIWFIFLL